MWQARNYVSIDHDCSRRMLRSLGGGSFHVPKQSPSFTSNIAAPQIQSAQSLGLPKKHIILCLTRIKIFSMSATTSKQSRLHSSGQVLVSTPFESASGKAVRQEDRISPHQLDPHAKAQPERFTLDVQVVDAAVPAGSGTFLAFPALNVAGTATSTFP